MGVHCECYMYHVFFHTDTHTWFCSTRITSKACKTKHVTQFYRWNRRLHNFRGQPTHLNDGLKVGRLSPMWNRKNHTLLHCFWLGLILGHSRVSIPTLIDATFGLLVKINTTRNDLFLPFSTCPSRLFNWPFSEWSFAASERSEKCYSL